ncbi:MAG: hypothetical protein KGS61_21755, partial [Verrucomicrobia bacterium]|nr:hypothetical protein [Verrucomicrobiota bacterium]
IYQYLGPVLESAVPPAGQNSTYQQPLNILLAPGSYPIDQGSIQLWLDGTNVTTAASINSVTNPAGGVQIKYLYPVLPAGTNTVAVVVSDEGTPPQTATNQYTFITQPLVTLNINLGTQLGTGDTNQPGFRYRLVQTTSANATANWENSVLQEEINLAGGLDPYTDPSAFIWAYTATGTNVPSALAYTVGSNGYAQLTNVVNFNHNAIEWGGSADIGDFQAPLYPDNPIPGLAVDQSGDNSADDYVTAEMLTYVQFPSAGYYEMGVNSDDGFRVSSATNQDYPVELVKINSPAGMATNMIAGEANFTPPLPQLASVGPITGKVVEAEPLDASAPLTNAAAIKGNIALIDRGSVTFASKIGHAEDAGAIAVIVADNHSGGDLIITMGNNGEVRTIPAVMINYNSGQSLHTAVEAGTTVNVTLSSHPYSTLGQFNGGRGSSDTLFGFNVPAAGVYPLRLMWFNGTGGANCEWFTIDRASGKYTLINDATSTNSLRAFQARANIPIPPPVTQPTLGVGLSGTTLTFTWTGTGVKLQSAATLSNPTWTDVSGGSASGATDQVSGTTKFYRLAPQ